jgi:transcriptional regulator with XRE-family HTH domain
MNAKARLARNFRCLGQRTGLSQERFALEHGIDRTYVSGIERGVRNPTIMILDKLTTAFGVDRHELLLEPCGSDSRS